MWEYNGLAYIDVHKSNGSSFDLERWSNGAFYWLPHFGMVAGDFNGDGKTDLATVIMQTTKGNYPDVEITTSTGGGFNPTSVWYVGTGGAATGAFVAGDFNGDGVDDLVNVGLYTAAPTGEPAYIQFTLYASQPTTQTFAVTNDYSQGVEGRQGNYIWSSTGTQLMAFCSGDFNGDGLADIGDAWDDNNNIDLDVHVQ